MSRAALVFVLAALALVGVVVYGFVSDTGDDADEAYDADTSRTDDDAGDSTGDDDGDDVTDDIGAADQPLVPRVLPPDAAIEDVRDAYAAKSAAAVKGVYERLARLAKKNASYRDALKRAANDESDKRVAQLVRTALTNAWSALDQTTRDALLEGTR